MESGESISPRARTIKPTNETISNFTGTLLPNGDKVPTWTDLPLDTKFPMIPSPKGTVSFHTTKLCERVSILIFHLLIQKYDIIFHERSSIVTKVTFELQNAHILMCRPIEKLPYNVGHLLLFLGIQLYLYFSS